VFIDQEMCPSWRVTALSEFEKNDQGLVLSMAGKTGQMERNVSQIPL